MFGRIDPKELNQNVFSMIGEQWMLVTAGTAERCNTMTASWGGLGVLWGKPVATVYIRPQRYTLEFVEREDCFTLSFFGEEYRKALALCGSKSGRDVDKVKECGFTVAGAARGAEDGMTENETKQAKNRAVLVGLNAHCLSAEENADDTSMEELADLLETAGGVCVGTVFQNKDAPDPRTFIGEGKAAEVKELVGAMGADMVVVDNPLSPSQQRVLSEELGVQVLDRAALILDIFAQRARTREGRLQVELAQYQYLLPRLLGMWTHLERQEGAIGTRGPGETQLETDRRHIRRKIQKLREELEQVRRVRATQRTRREKNEVPVVAIVGYTNAGKSTLLNRLTGADIPANNRLFDTLDTTTRTLEISDTCTVLLSDTVGFIRKLPHHLVEAFKATLEELSYADLLLHVIDASNPLWREQAAVVEQLIVELGAEQTPRIDVFNKCDKFTGDILPHGADIVSISAKTGQGLDELLEKIGGRLDTGACRVVLRLPYDQGGVVDMLHRQAKVERVDYGEAIEVEAVCTPVQLGRLKDYIVSGWTPPKEPWED